MGRYMMKLEDNTGRERYVDVPRLWSVEPDERLYDLDPPPEWCFQAGQRLTLVDDDLMRWEAEVVDDTRADWEVRCRILGPSFMVKRFGTFYEGVDVVLDVPRQRLIDEKRMAALDQVDALVEKALDPKTGLLRKLSFDECEATERELEAARDALAPLFGGLVPYDSHVGHYECLCDYYLWQIAEWRRRMPKQLSLFGDTVAGSTKKAKERSAPAEPRQVPPPRTTEQLTLFS